MGVGGGAANGGASSAPGGAPTLDDFLGGGDGGTATGTTGGAASGGGGGAQGALQNGRRNSSGSNAEQAWPPPARQRAGTAGSASSAATPSLIGSGGGVDLSALVLGEGVGSGAPAGFSFGGRAMKPLAIATGEFGQKWMACSGERRAAGSRLSPGLGSPKAVAERLGGKLGVHTVEVIPHTAEGICAGQLDGGGVCLVHCKVGGRVGSEVLCLGPAFRRWSVLRVRWTVQRGSRGGYAKRRGKLKEFCAPCRADAVVASAQLRRSDVRRFC